MKRFFLSLMMIVGVIFTGCAFTNNQVSTKKARLIYVVPKKVEASKIKEALLNAITLRTQDVKDVENLIPEQLPDKPGHPIQKNIFGALNAIAAGNPKLEATQLDTSNAWYTVEGTETMGTPFNRQYVVYKGAIYPYKNGYKVYIYEFYQEGVDGIMGHITKAIAETISGEKAPLLFIAQIGNRFQQKVPEAKLVNAVPSELKKIKLNLWNKGNLGLDK